MKIFNKFIWSKKEPSNKNDIWFDGSTWKIYTEEAWQSFTLPVDAADKISEMLENISEVYQEKLTAGEGIIIEDNEINLTLKTINGESIIGEGNIIIESNTSSGESSVFEAIYGETTYDDIVEQYNANKHVIVKYAEEFLSLAKITKNRIDFTTIVNNNSIRVSCSSDNVWNPYGYTLEWTRDKVKTINAESTDTQYPSAKAVYEALQNLPQGGGDSPFEKGDAENSVVLKGGNNQVISEGGVALGKDNLVGLKGFYYKYITLKAGGNTKLANVYLSKTQVSNPTIDTNSGASYKDASIKPQNYLAVGDIISIVNDAKYDDIATIKQVKDGLVQIEWLDGKSPFSTVKTESNLSSEDYSIYCLDKPENGIADLGQYSFANGTDNKAINTYTEVSGKGNVAKGKFAKVWGKDNIGGYNTTTFGSGNVNLADNSLVNGTNNINEGNNSVIHGNKNKNYGKRAFVVGNENITNNENEAAFGKYNNSENDTQFSIGFGTSNADRKNAFEVKQNGDIYIEGVEGRIQDILNGDSSATPDWNAREGEVGFINNKPFNLVIQNIDFELYDEKACAYISDIYEYDGFCILDKPLQFNGNYNFTIDYYEGFEQYNGITIEFQSSDILVTPNHIDTYVGDTIEGFVDYCNSTIKLFKIKVIDALFIPDTVLKTTPQTLSDTDKNQALANLGIADLLEALKPVRLSEEPPIGNVTQEQLDEIGLTEKVINNILNGYTNKICIKNSMYYVTDAYTNFDDVVFIFVRIEFYNQGISSLTQYKYSKMSDEITITLEEM